MCVEIEKAPRAESHRLHMLLCNPVCNMCIHFYKLIYMFVWRENAPRAVARAPQSGM